MDSCHIIDMPFLSDVWNVKVNSLTLLLANSVANNSPNDPILDAFCHHLICITGTGKGVCVCVWGGGGGGGEGGYMMTLSSHSDKTSWSPSLYHHL